MKDETFYNKRRELLLKGDYTRLEVIVNNEEQDYPYLCVEQNNSTMVEMAILYKITSKVLEDIERKFPELKEIQKKVGIDKFESSTFE